MAKEAKKKDSVWREDSLRGIFAIIIVFVVIFAALICMGVDKEYLSALATLPVGVIAVY